MSPAEELRRLANEILTRLQQRVPILQRELEDIEARKAEINAKLDAASLAAKRAANFPVTDGVNFRCARCWMDDGVVANLKSIGRPAGDTSNDDFFRCTKCNHPYQFSLDR